MDKNTLIKDVYLDEDLEKIIIKPRNRNLIIYLEKEILIKMKSISLFFFEFIKFRL